MITGKDLIESGWTQGPEIGLAREYADLNMSDTGIMMTLDDIKRNPIAYMGLDGKIEGAEADLARALGRPVQLDDTLRAAPLFYQVWGRDGIDQATLDQMNLAMRLPITVAGALMPDAHRGCGLPVGGVLATKGAVIPYAVGFDIECRMRFSVTDIKVGDITYLRRGLVDALMNQTYFGAGNGERGSDHPVMSDAAWANTPCCGGSTRRRCAIAARRGEERPVVPPRSRGDSGVRLVETRGACSAR